MMLSLLDLVYGVAGAGSWLQFLSAADLCAVALTSKELRSVADTAVVWRSLFNALQAAGSGGRSRSRSRTTLPTRPARGRSDARRGGRGRGSRGRGRHPAPGSRTPMPRALPAASTASRAAGASGAPARADRPPSGCQSWKAAYARAKASQHRIRTTTAQRDYDKRRRADVVRGLKATVAALQCTFRVLVNGEAVPLVRPGAKRSVAGRGRRPSGGDAGSASPLPPQPPELPSFHTSTLLRVRLPDDMQRSEVAEVEVVAASPVVGVQRCVARFHPLSQPRLSPAVHSPDSGMALWQLPSAAAFPRAVVAPAAPPASAGRRPPRTRTGLVPAASRRRSGAGAGAGVGAGGGRVSPRPVLGRGKSRHNMNAWVAGSRLWLACWTGRSGVCGHIDGMGTGPPVDATADQVAILMINLTHVDVVNALLYGGDVPRPLPDDVTAKYGLMNYTVWVGLRSFGKLVWCGEYTGVDAVAPCRSRIDVAPASARDTSAAPGEGRASWLTFPREVPDGTPTTGGALDRATFWLLDPGLATLEGGRQLSAPPLLQWRAGTVHGVMEEACVVEFCVWDEHQHVVWSTAEVASFRPATTVAAPALPSATGGDGGIGYSTDLTMPDSDRFVMCVEAEPGRLCVECAVVADRYCETGEGGRHERGVRRVSGRFAGNPPVIVRSLWFELVYAFVDRWFGTRYV